MFDNTANANEAAAGAATVTDTITVLTCKPGKFLAKRIQPDGADINYDKAKFFDIEERLFHDVAELGALLQEIARDPRRCIVLAELIDKSRCRHVRRLGKAKENYPPTLKRVPRRYVGIDFDNLPMPEGVAHEDLEACARAAIAHLPPEFHGAAGWVQATSGHGRKPEMRLRLWYCLSRPVWEAEFKLWLGVVPGTDGSVYGGIQPIFVANPVFENGAVDHLPRRWLMLPGADAVTVPDEFPMPQRMAGGRTYETPFNGPPVPTTEAAAEELRAACAAIEAAMPGNRHATARDATWRLAQLIKGGLLDHAEAEAALCAALVAAGKADGAQELRDLLTSALARAPAAEPWIAAEDEFDAEPLDEDEDEPEATDEPEDREPPGREDDMEDISEEGAAAAGGDDEAAAGNPAGESATLPRIPVRGGNLPEQVDQMEAALIAAGLGLYQQGGELVRVGLITEKAADGTERQVQRAISVSEAHLHELANKAAIWMHFDARKRRWVRKHAPQDVARAYLARRGIGWKLPVLTGIINCPTLRADGSVLDQPGYDPATGLIFDPGDEAFPPVPAQPTREAAAAALALLNDLISEFPFKNDASRSVALAAILTGLVRRTLDAAPLFGFDAPTPGTGKSYLVSTIAAIATGQAAAGLGWGMDEKENIKALDAALISGANMIVLDNVDVELKGARLNQVLSEQQVEARVLGLSKIVKASTAAVFMANGNNLTVAADMTRRVVLCTLDAGMERPELREFRGDPVAQVKADRGRYVVAALTVLRAYHVAGRPGRPKALGSFGAWSDLIRGALIWLDEADPVETMETVRENDPKRAELLAVLEGWNALIEPGRRLTAREIALEAPAGEFREALVAVAGINGTPNTRRLGVWLRGVRGTLVNGMKIEHAGVREGNTLWQLHGGRTAGGGEEPINFAAERAKRAAEAAAAAAAADGLDVPPPPRPPGFEGDWPPDPKLWPWPGMPDHDPLAAEMWREFGWG